MARKILDPLALTAALVLVAALTFGTVSLTTAQPAAACFTAMMCPW